MIRISATTPPPALPDARLRAVVGDLEGVFVEQLFKAMRQTVPEDGLTDGGAGEDVFTAMLDQHLSAEVPGQWRGGLGDALLRQLHPEPDAPPSPLPPPPLRGSTR